MAVSKTRKIKKWFRGIIISMVCLMMMPFCAVPANADVATDYISVRVGYIGMELDEYVLVGKYHWSELANNLPTYEVAYSYFQQGNSKKKYSAIVDSANGFMVSDILAYSNIYTGDVRNLKFYVEDHKGIQAAFDKSSLFSTRYYFDDLAGHRTVEYDDSYNVVSYSFDDAWNAKYKVEPMLALEDNWETFNEEFEHIGPNFEGMGSGSRFRLEFGQRKPTETMTSSSAKYVSCVYVTLNGQPKIGDMPKLDGSYGSHEVEMTVSANNESIRNALSDLMKINSTNKDVLVISGVKVTASDVYSDLATIRISYEIVGEGDASISFGIGSDKNTIASSAVVHSSTKNNDEDKGTLKTGEEDKDGTLTASAKAEGSSSSPDLSKDKKGKTEHIEADQAKAKSSTYVLSKDAQQRLEEMLTSQTLTNATEEVTEVKQEEDLEKERRKKMILLTCLCSIGLCGLGGAAELLSFKIRLNRRLKIRKV